MTENDGWDVLLFFQFPFATFMFLLPSYVRQSLIVEH